MNITRCKNFNPCNAYLSNARIVTVFTFMVADAARRHGLRIARRRKDR